MCIYMYIYIYIYIYTVRHKKGSPYKIVIIFNNIQTMSMKFMKFIAK